jgi:HAMP domain-containing protein
MDWWPDGPCAALLIRDVRLPSMRPMRYAGLGILVVILSAALGIALAAWPVVRRLRRLTEEVKDSAKEFDLQVDVQGRDEVKLLETAFEQVHGACAQNRSVITTSLRGSWPGLGHASGLVPLPIAISGPMTWSRSGRLMSSATFSISKPIMGHES